MKNFTFQKTAVLGMCLAALIIAPMAIAQSVHHDVMDAKAARRDIIRLQQDRRMARQARNWGKVAQDDRLIAADRKFMHKDIRKAVRGG